jgi:site-specific recombinase XerD
MADEDNESGWLLAVLGKGHKIREVPIPSELVEQARALARARGASDKAYLIGKVAGKLGQELDDPDAPLAASWVAAQIREHMQRLATELRVQQRDKLAGHIEKASAHWLRHSHASHALESGVELAGVQANLGHASLGTTSVYVTTEQKRRLKQMRGFWKAQGAQDQPESAAA